MYSSWYSLCGCLVDLQHAEVAGRSVACCRNQHPAEDILVTRGETRRGAAGLSTAAEHGDVLERRVGALHKVQDRERHARDLDTQTVGLGAGATYTVGATAWPSG